DKTLSGVPSWSMCRDHENGPSEAALGLGADPNTYNPHTATSYQSVSSRRMDTHSIALSSRGFDNRDLPRDKTLRSSGFQVRDIPSVSTAWSKRLSSSNQTSFSYPAPVYFSCSRKRPRQYLLSA